MGLNIFNMDAKKAIFSILMVTIIFSILEIFLFYKDVVPKVTDEIETVIDKTSDKMANIINEKNKSLRQNPLIDIKISENLEKIFNDKNSNLLNIISTREQINIDRINSYRLYGAIFLVICLFILLFVTWYMIKFKNIDLLENSDLSYTFLTVSFTVGCLLVFQVIFYFYTKHYKYFGSMGKNEIIYTLIKNIG